MSEEIDRSFPTAGLSAAGKGEGSDRKGVYAAGGIAALFVALASLADIAIGFSLGGDLTALPHTAIDRFIQFRQSPWLGLYSLDLLNVLTTFVLVAAFLGLYAAHRRIERALATLAMIVELVGATVFVANNAALPMLALSAKYTATTTEAQRALLAGAGEAMLARGEHGSPGVFLGFFLLSIAGILMSWAILKGRVFNRATAWTGILSNSLLLAYVVLVTFVPGTKSAASLISAPGGVLAIAWLILIGLGLTRMGRSGLA